MKEKIIEFFKKYWIAFVIVIACYVADLITKIIVTNAIEWTESNGKLLSVKSIEVIENFFTITYTRNTGAGWSMLSGKTTLLIFISIVALGFFGFLMKDFNMKTRKFYSLGLSLMLGGLFGNFIERIAHGYVTDFLDFLIFGYDFPVFNVADMCLVAGAISLLVSMIFTKEDVFEIKKKNPLDSQAEAVDSQEPTSDEGENK